MFLYMSFNDNEESEEPQDPHVSFAAIAMNQRRSAYIPTLNQTARIGREPSLECTLKQSHATSSRMALIGLH